MQEMSCAKDFACQRLSKYDFEGKGKKRHFWNKQKGGCLGLLHQSPG